MDNNITILINVSFTITATITFTFIMQRLKDYRHKKSVPASTPLKKDSLTVELAKSPEGFRFCLIKKKSS